MNDESQLERSCEMHSPKRYRRNSTLRTVDLYRRSGGFGFTLSSQGPCVLSCILAGSPAHKAGLQPGDQIIEVNGTSVEQTPHEQVVKLIARSPNATVKLGVRNRAETHREAKKSRDTDKDNSEETVINDTILNRVDKVVEELRSGRLFGNSPSFNRSISNGKFISDEEIVSDEELKATFYESVRSEIPVQSFSPGQSDSDTRSRRSNEGDSKCNLYTPKFSRVLYPAMTPLKREASGTSADIDLEPELRAIVGYLGSIELPAASCLPTASLNAIRNCVRRLRAQQKVHIFFLMEISLVGIRLLDSKKRTVVTYPLRSLAFTGLCSDDKRVFGIVTRKTNESSSENILSNSRNYKTDEQNTVNCSCHVFSVDPELTSHDLHQDIAHTYGVQCTSQEGTECMEFPSSSSPILRSITGMFKERSGSESAGTSSDGEGYLAHRARSASLSSSQSESDIVTKDTHPEELSVKCNASSTVTDEHDANLAHVKNHQPVELEIDSKDNHISATNSTQNEEVTTVGYKHYSSEANDSGVGLDSFHHSDGFSQGVGTAVAVPLVVSVSSCHSCASSAESHLSMDLQHSCGGPLEPGVDRKPQLKSAVYQMGTNDCPSLGNSQESLAHSDIVLGHSSSQKPLDTCASISSSTQSIHSLGDMPGGMSHMDGRVARWALGFDKLMEDPAGLGCLKEFLKKEFSEENIVFWISCENFRNIVDFEELKEEAANIFHNHLDANAPMPVNVDSCAVKDAEEQLPNPNNDMFRLQQQQVYTLMKFDSYPRFLKSDVYRQCLVAEMEGVPLPFEEGEEVRDSKGRGFFKKRSSRARGSKHGSKRSTSTVDGERKKSFLPWKGKHVRKGDRSFGSQPGSARSSLSSLSDSIHNISYSSESLQVDQRRESESFQFCRVILPDQSSTILLCKEGQTLRQALLHLCERRQLSFVAHEVFLGGADKLVPLDELDEDMSIMGGREIILEHRTLFRLELPDGVTLYVKVKPNQSVRACLEPILARQGISFDHVTIHLAGCEVPLGPGIPVASIEHQLVVVETEEQKAGNVHSQRSPRFVGKPPFASRTSRRGSKNNAIDDVAFEGVMRGKNQTLGNGYFDDTGVWVSTTSTLRSGESHGGVIRPEGSFGKSLLKGQGLFGRKRREGSESHKGIPVDVKSGRFGGERPGDVKDFFDLISRAQGKRMDDQRGELKGNLELPDFLKLPVENKSTQSNGRSVIPNAPPPPLFRTADSNPTRPVVKKSLSTPAHLHEQVDFMQELAERLSKRGGSVKNNSIRTDGAVDNAQRQKTELNVDYNFNSRRPTGQTQYRPHEVGAQEKGRNISRPRSATDGAAHNFVTKTGTQRVEPGNHAQPFGGTEPRKNIAHVHPSVRPQASQPVTVNSLRGMYHHGTNPRQNTADKAMYHHPSNVGNVKPLTMTKVSSKSSQSLRDHAPAIYDVKRGALAMDVRDDSINVSGVNAAFQKMISSYSLPEVSSHKAEVHIPCQGGPPPVPRRQVFNGDRRPRPKPISDPQDLITGLEKAPSGEMEQPPNSPLRVGSPLPPPPTPPSGPLNDLQIADFSPPPPIHEFPVLPTELQDAKVEDSSNVTQSPPQNRNFATNSTSLEGQGNDESPVEFSGPVAYVNLPSEETGVLKAQRTREHEKQFTSPPMGDSHKSDSNWIRDSGDVTSAQLQRSSAVIGPGSVTPAVSKFNKTLTPPSSHEKTLVEDPSVGDGTPYAGHRPPMDSATKRLMSSPASGSRPKRRDHEKRRSRQSSEIPKLDPYVTYENEDLRITFV